jgi:AraC-like DNA-binding protein
MRALAPKGLTCQSMDRDRHGTAWHTAVTAYQICAEAVRSGVRPGELRVLTGLERDELTDFARRIPAARLFAVWEAVMRRVADPAFPVRAALHATADARSAVYFLAAASPDVRAGIVNSVANVSAWTTAYTMCARAEADGSLRLTLDGLDADRLGTRCEAEFQLADFVAGLKNGIGPVTPRLVTFAHPAPRDTATHREHFGPGLVFGAPHNEIVFGPELLALPVPGAQPGLADVLADHVAALRASETVPLSYGVRLRDWLLGRFRAGEPATAPAAARALTVSERTLHRRLAAEGTTFRLVREETRRQYAVDLVRASPRAFKEIASLAGFADSRSFHRAYLRWTGTTPGRDRGVGGR